MIPLNCSYTNDDVREYFNVEDFLVTSAVCMYEVGKSPS